MNTRQLTYVVSIAETGNLSAAAKELGVSQPALSKYLAELEDELGTELFLRYKKQLYPINLTFSLEDYPHLAGFQYMKDISLPNYSSAKIADRILEGKIQWANAKK